MDQQPQNLNYAASQPVKASSTSGMAITSLVLGILAIVSSWMPIVNNFSMVLAVLGVVFAIIGLVGIRKGKKKGQGLAIAGLVLGILSGIIVLATQGLYGAAIDAAREEINPSIAATSNVATSDNASSDTNGDSNSDSSSDSSADNAQEEAPDYSNLSLGESIELTDGSVITVNSVESGLTNYDDSPVTGVSVTYTNNGSKEVSFNPYDWKAQDAQGAQYSQGYYSDADNALSSGTLAPGGTVTGNVYFDGDITKVLYYSNMFNDSATAGWVVE